jgi:hypothetical protein
MKMKCLTMGHELLDDVAFKFPNNDESFCDVNLRDEKISKECLEELSLLDKVFETKGGE